MTKSPFKLILIVFLAFSISSIANSREKHLDLFNQIFDKVQSDYVDEITDEELIEKAIEGMLSGLDPHSGYMNEEVWKEMKTDTSGKFGGLGIEITMEDGFVKVISPIEDTPAYRAGVKAGDYIIKINETAVLGLTLNEAVELMRGKKGAPIKITIAREGLEPFEIEIIRDIIKVQSVKHELFEDIGYLRITSFTEQTEAGIIKSIKKIRNELNQKELGYILDLRSNPGGLLTQAVKVTDIFLDKGVIVSTKGRKKIDNQNYYARNGDLIKNKPLVIIINGGSASAAEIVAGALKDHGRAIIIGTKTFGKGSVQTIIPFKKINGSIAGIRLTTAIYYTPSGESIQGKGILPDILVEQGNFESNENTRFSESDLKGAIENEQESENTINDDQNNKITDQEFRLKKDFQLRRAVDLIKGLSIYKNSINK